MSDKEDQVQQETKDTPEETAPDTEKVALETPETPQDAAEPQDSAEGTSTPVEPEEAVPEPSEALAGAEKDLAVPKDKDDASRLGVKESTENPEAMAMAKKDAEDGDLEGEPAAPSFFVDEDKRHKVEVDILCGRKDGQVLSVSRTGLGIDYKEFKYLTHVQEWFEFTVPSYEDMSSYRQRCGVYRQEAQQVLIDRLQLRNFMLVWHLKDWSLRGPDGEKVELSHDENGSLSDEALKKVYKTHTTILDVVLTILEKDILLT